MAIHFTRHDFSRCLFEQKIKEFLYADIRISARHEEIIHIDEKLSVITPSFVSIITSYYSSMDNSRYDRMIEDMERFIRHYQGLMLDTELTIPQHALLSQFWDYVVDMIYRDCLHLDDNYLTNSYNYLVSEIKKLL